MVAIHTLLRHATEPQHTDRHAAHMQKPRLSSVYKEPSQNDKPAWESGWPCVLATPPVSRSGQGLASSCCCCLSGASCTSARCWREPQAVRPAVCHWYTAAEVQEAPVTQQQQRRLPPAHTSQSAHIICWHPDAHPHDHFASLHFFVLLLLSVARRPFLPHHNNEQQVSASGVNGAATGGRLSGSGVQMISDNDLFKPAAPAAGAAGKPKTSLRLGQPKKVRQ